MKTSSNVLEEFSWRGMIHRSNGQQQYTPGLTELLSQRSITGYIGFDPTSDSLHVGSLLPIMCLAHLQRWGDSPIVIVGGGTGLIGDPSGKKKERPLLTLEKIESNLLGIKTQLSRFLDFESKTNPARIINNADWLEPIKTLDFLREIGKHFTINYMLAKESVRRRIDDPDRPSDKGSDGEEGMSFTEFSYMLLQAYDYLVLYDRNNCVLQLGGSDQWGNITAGIELIRKVRGGQAHGLVTPLLTNNNGGKFGKTEDNTIWLDPMKTSPFLFYQFWLNTPDSSVIPYLKIFTLLSREQIKSLEDAVATNPGKREAQKRLADEVTRIVHGETGVNKARKAASVLFEGDLLDITAHDLLEVFKDVPSVSIDKHSFETGGVPLIDIVLRCGLVSSRGEAKRLIQGGGIYLNNRKFSEIQHVVSLDQTVGGEVLIIRRGSREHRVVHLI